MDEQVGYIVVGVVLVFLLAFVAGLFIGALFLRWSVRILQGFRPPYGRALLVVFLATIASFAASVALVFAMQAAGLYDIEAMATAATPDPQAMMAMMGAQAALSLGNFVFALLATALFVKLLIEAPDGTAPGYGRSLLVALLYVLMMTALMIGVVVVLAVVIGIGTALYAPA